MSEKRLPESPPTRIMQPVSRRQNRRIVSKNHLPINQPNEAEYSGSAEQPAVNLNEIWEDGTQAR